MIICFEQNYVSFNNEIYIHSGGLAKGSPLPGIMAEIFHNNIERKSTNDCKQSIQDKPHILSDMPI